MIHNHIVECHKHLQEGLDHIGRRDARSLEVRSMSRNKLQKTER